MARYHNQPPAPKPYGFVPIQRLGEGDKKDPAAVGHDSYKPGTVSGTLRGEIIALSPVHVDSGTLEMQNVPDLPLYKAHVRSRGRVIIPGSTLKGVVRSVVEAISPSCVRVTRVPPHQLPRNAAGCRDKKHLCAACRMFGSLGYLGQVRFTDAVLREGQRTQAVEIPSLYAPRSRAAIYAKQGSEVEGRKFYQHGQPARGNMPIEVCPVDSVLDFTLHFDNLRQDELGLLLTALGLGDPPLALKLGGGKPVCYGSIQIRLNELEAFDDAKAAYTDYDITQAGVSNPKAYLDAAPDLVDANSLRSLADLLRVDTSRECPEGNY
jgi:CRISPR/Cas system CSM-associated protein Csm3 (group 7 of RAMP superfamily)